MKGIDISCASQASTAVCISLDQPSSSSSNQLGGRTIDRYNPIIRDLRRTPKTLSLTPCTSQPPPIDPQPYRLLQKSKSYSNTTKDQKTFRKSNTKKDKKSNSDQKQSKADGKKKDSSKKIWGKSVADFITPPGSSRYLLSEKDLIDFDPGLAVVPSESNMNLCSSSSSSSNASLRPSPQVFDFFPNQ